MIKTVNSDLLQINDNVLVERGARRVEAIATKELLDDRRTAGHYQAGKFDALGKIIVLGELFTYLDWYEFQSGGGVWYVYELVDDQAVPRGFFDTQAEAVEAGLKL